MPDEEIAAAEVQDTMDDLIAQFNDGTSAPALDDMPASMDEGDEGEAGPAVDDEGNPVVKDEGGKPAGEEEPKPDAESSLIKTVLDKHGLTAAELDKALAEGKSLKEIIGDRDAKSLVEAADQIRRHEAEEVLRQEQELEEKETPEETIARLKQQRLDLQSSQTKAQQDKAALEESRRALETLNKTLKSVVVGTEGLEESDHELVLLLLGTDNPINDVDIDHVSEVKTEANSLIAKFKAFKESIAQKAVDEYVKGKGKITGKEDKTVTDVKGKVEAPVKKAGEEGKPKKMVSGSAINKGFQAANDEMMAIIKQAESA